MRTENNRLYICDEGKVFRRKKDKVIMGEGLDLGDNDSIDNYEEIKPRKKKEDKEED